MTNSYRFVVTLHSDFAVSPVELLAALRIWSEGEWDVESVEDTATGQVITLPPNRRRPTIHHLPEPGR